MIKSSEQEWEEVGPGISRKITGYNDDLMMVLVKFEEGGVGEPHSHVHSQSTYIASGAFEVTVDGNTELLQQGDCFFAPPHAVHGVVCKSAGTLIDVFNPIREDFL
ncbi:cupin domain-containing protein [Reichenbachiella carrageenanivorans]|uniref:Cupin domain-containing protein n=1 Tax=Reichenbachiella carrageenanivorans TaxID=2979869 RepID=A0ABY6CZQ9_9BACT|nr:cupin domain-containing protein [Reichenbachiella carrageenanivorans]UXX79397.1 cupin domain-containing protein [Reichenbachiella carrageenanivorans]